MTSIGNNRSNPVVPEAQGLELGSSTDASQLVGASKKNRITSPFSIQSPASASIPS